MLKFPILLLFLFVNLFAFSQNEKVRPVPEVELKDLSGKTVKSNEILNLDGLTIIDFWATWCKPCISALDNIAEVYPKWQKETGVKLLAISIDDARNVSKVGPLAKGRDWPYEVYLDTNSDLRRALNVNNVPHTFLVNKKGEIIWQHNSYSPGDEDELFEILKKEAAKN